jgi:hypothetical protein
VSADIAFTLGRYRVFGPLKRLLEILADFGGLRMDVTAAPEITAQAQAADPVEQ